VKGPAGNVPGLVPRLQEPGGRATLRRVRHDLRSTPPTLSYPSGEAQPRRGYAVLGIGSCVRRVATGGTFLPELNDPQRKQLDFLLADFTATKAEIGRRSTLQRAALAAYLAVVAVAFQGAATVDERWLIALWIASALAFQFYARESLEIDRLGIVIRERIAPLASGVLGTPVEQLLPSETNAEVLATRPRRVAYDKSFNWAVFAVVPLLFTLVYAAQHSEDIRRLWQCGSQTCWATLAVLVGATRAVTLLIRHA